MVLTRYQSSKMQVSIFGVLSILRQSHYTEESGTSIWQFSNMIVGKMWDGRETGKSPIVWDFPDI